MREVWKKLLPGILAMVLAVTGLPMQQVFAAEDNASPEILQEVDSETEDEYILNYLMIEKPYIETPDIQKIAVSIGEGHCISQNPVLYYKNQETGETFSCTADKMEANAILFTIDHSKEESAVYSLIEIRFEAAGQEKRITFDECGIDAQYGVNKEVTSSNADAVLLDEDKDALNITVTDADGNTLSKESFGEVLEQAESGMQAFVSFARNASSIDPYADGKLVVVLDPGHDNRHSGASHFGVNEQDLTLKIAKYCKEELERYNNVEVYLTRDTGDCAWGKNVALTDCLEYRAEFALQKKADIFVSIHLNADETGKADGAEVYYPNKNYRPEIGAEGQKVAQAILDELGKLGIHKREIKAVNAKEDKYPDGSAADYYKVIRECKKRGIPGLIVEHAFLSNADDYNNYLNSDEKLKKLGVADAAAIAEYYGLEKRFAFKWTNLGSESVAIGDKAQLYYAVTESASVNIEVFDGNNNYLKTLVSGKKVATNDQVINWDLKNGTGSYVNNGTYRFTITATNEAGEKIIAHKYFKVTGNEPLSYKWTNLGANSVKIGESAQLYYAVNKAATIKVEVFYGNNNFLKTIVSDKKVLTNDQVANWDLTDGNGDYVNNGTYRFTITATTEDGEKIVAHKWFNVIGSQPLSYKWTVLGSSSAKIGESIQLYYAVNKRAAITVEVFDGSNNYLKTLVSNYMVATNDQVANWDLTDRNGNYVENGTYRFTITATNTAGEKIVAHKYFKVTGNDPLAYKWTNLDTAVVEGGKNISLYYAVNKKATITVEMFYGNNNFMKTLVSEKVVGTNDQVIGWNLTDRNGKYVEPGQYRFTITAVDANGKKIVAHKYFRVNSFSIMGESSTTVEKMAAYYKDRYTYPAFYANTEAPTIEDFCRIYMEECTAEGIKAEVAFCQSMKETGFLQYPGATCVVKHEQFNFAGLDTTGNIKEDGTVDVGRSYPDVRTGIRAHVQRLKAWAVKGITPSSYQYECIDPYKFDSPWWVSTIIGSSPYVEWLGKQQNPSGYGWATDPNYGYSIKNDYLLKLLSY